MFLTKFFSHIPSNTYKVQCWKFTCSETVLLWFHAVVVVCLGLAAYYFIFKKIIFITFLYFFVLTVFFLAILWWPVQRAFVAFLVTWNNYDDDDRVSDFWIGAKSLWLSFAPFQELQYRLFYTGTILSWMHRWHTSYSSSQDVNTSINYTQLSLNF